MSSTAEPRVSVTHTSAQAQCEGDPDRDAPFDHPQRSPPGRAPREDPATVAAPPTALCDEQQRTEQGDGTCALAQAPEHDREDRCFGEQTRRLSPAVVRLAHALGPEVARRGRAPRDVDPGSVRDPPPVRADGAFEFQVLEQHFGIVPAHGGERGPSQPVRARVVFTQRAIEQAAARIPPRVPGGRGEVVLRFDEIGGAQGADHGDQRGAVVPHIVVREDDALVARGCDSREHPVHLAVARAGAGHRKVPHDTPPGVSMRREPLLVRPVDDGDVDPCGELSQVRRHLGELVIRAPAQRDDVLSRFPVAHHAAISRPCGIRRAGGSHRRTV